MRCKNCIHYDVCYQYDIIGEDDNEMCALYEKQRPHGEWIIVDDCEHFIAKCSVCGRIEDSRIVENYPFCRCGAKMKGCEENEQT